MYIIIKSQYQFITSIYFLYLFPVDINDAKPKDHFLNFVAFKSIPKLYIVWLEAQYVNGFTINYTVCFDLYKDIVIVKSG